MNANKLKDIIDRYLRGECSLREASLIEHWLEQNTRTSLPLSEDEELALKLDMLRHIKNSIQPRAIISKGRNFAHRLLAAAVALLLLSTAAWYIFHWSKETTDSPLYSSRTQAGEFKKITLPDSSLIWLGENSQLEYPQAFPRDKREVKLVYGEAFFEISPRKDKPFIVHSDRLQTKVLGTSFHIRSHHEQEEYAIMVTSGKVEVQHDDANGQQSFSRQLLAGDGLLYNKQQQQASLFKSDPAPEAWKTGKLVFVQTSMADVVSNLNSKFNTSIQLRNIKLADTRLTATFHAHTSLEDILQSICLLKKMNYRITSTSIVIE